jgi:tetratricopeptide (TPR) repeat protein
VTPAQLLQRFKSLWAAGEWVEALTCYRTWTNRAGKKRVPRIEAELLFRGASDAYQKGDFEKALARLEEASLKDPAEAGRYLPCKAICLAKKGKLKESIDQFTEARDDFHSLVLSSLLERMKPLPKREPVETVFEAYQLAGFWRGLCDPNAAEPSSTVLRNIKAAFSRLRQGEEPDPPLESLRDKPGCETLALHLLLLVAVHGRRNVRIRHLIESDPPSFRDESLLSLLDLHLALLLKEKDYREIEVLMDIFGEHGIRPDLLRRVADESLFASALQDIDAGRLEEALDRFRRIGRRTPSLIHNIALLHQKMGKYAEANENWISLLKIEKKPKKSDPEEKRLAYVTAVKFIASNYLLDDKPEKAEPFLKEALYLSEDDRDTLESLVDLSLELGEQRQAYTYTQRLYELDPDSEQYYLGYLAALLGRGRMDLLLPLIEERWEKYAKDSPARMELAYIALHAAWKLRASEPQKARGIIAMVKEIGVDTPQLTYLEGYYLVRDGNRERAGKCFDRLIEQTENHAEQALLGMELYDEGFHGHSIGLFTRLISCGCDASRDAFDDIIAFLAMKNDHEAARELCLYALDSEGYHPYDVADSLYIAEKPHWAREFSERLLEDPDSDEEDYFLHLLILNGIGNGGETLAFAESIKRRFAESGDPDFISVMNQVMKQLRTKGRVKIPYV